MKTTDNRKALHTGFLSITALYTKQRIAALLAVLLSCICLSPALLAQGDSPVRFANIAQKQVITLDDEGKERIELTDVDIMVPGDTVVYTSTFTNIGQDTVSNIIVSNPIPKNTQYIVFTAKGKSTVITFSVDGGKTYAAAAKLTVVDENGQTQTAQPKHYTDIRWVYQGQLAKGKASSVSFQVNIL
jgi:uncharacterized repeat protein (TIGR01451 family)